VLGQQKTSEVGVGKSVVQTIEYQKKALTLVWRPNIA